MHDEGILNAIADVTSRVSERAEREMERAEAYYERKIKVMRLEHASLQGQLSAIRDAITALGIPKGSRYAGLRRWAEGSGDTDG